MCAYSQALLFLGFFASVIGFVVWYGRLTVRRAAAACVGHYDWWVFVDREGRNPEAGRQIMLLNGIDERDVDTIRRHRLRYRQVALAVFLLLGLVWLGIADLVRPLCA